jgi:hypothetical protein
MSTSKREAYMTKFKTFTPAKKREHLTFILANLLHILKSKRDAQKLGAA